jgi:glycosyltransferase involved in cell wall biosynthesis
MPLFSIITVNYNNRSGLERTMKSVFGQTYKDFEYIIIDGGSNDGSADLIISQAMKLSYAVSEKDSGIYQAMNKGVSIAKGKYCLFLNSGDFLQSPDVLRNVSAENSNADILYGNMLIDFGNGNLYPGKMPKNISPAHLVEDTLWHPVSFIRRTLLLNSGGYDEQFRIAADYDFFVRMLILEKVSTHYIDMPVTVFEANGISSKPENQVLVEKERRSIQDKYFEPAFLESQRLLIENKKKKANSMISRIIKRLIR